MLNNTPHSPIDSPRRHEEYQPRNRETAEPLRTSHGPRNKTIRRGYSRSPSFGLACYICLLSQP